ncbi:MAG: restriction endonuclease subunit S [Cyanobacteria bacterium J06621_8]
MQFPRYESYKDSGVEWLGEIPKHWEIKKLKYTVHNISEKTDCIESKLSYIGLENIESWTGKRIITGIEAEGTANKFECDDILFGKLRPYLAKVYLTKEKGLCTTEALVLRPSNQNRSFLFYLLLSSDFIGLISSSVYGAKMPRASWDFIGSQFISLPSLKEQNKIVNFLDQKTAEIEEAIAKKQRLIELLQEQKAILINRAVTKGLNPNVTMCDSSIEWIGEIPEHWELKKVGHLAKVVRGASPRPAGDRRFFSPEAGIPWVTVAEVTKDSNIYLDSTKEFLTTQGEKQSQVFYENTVIFTNSGATLGVPKIISVSCCANDGILALKYLNSEVDREYIYFYLYNQTVRLREEIKQGSAQPNLNTDIVKNIFITLPSINEQKKIVVYIKNIISEIYSCQSKVRNEIELLKELKQILISNAVTGKIKI